MASRRLIDDAASDFLGFTRRFVDVTAVSALLTDARRPEDLSAAGCSNDAIVASTPVNDLQGINDFFREANSILAERGILVGRLETIEHRRRALEVRYPGLLSYIARTLDFVVNRLLPRLPVTRDILSLLPRGPHRGLSLTECLGRLTYCGFDILDFAVTEGETWFAARVAGPPLTHRRHSHGPVFAMRRIGQGGREIRVFKFRTMHPYSEYLQEFIYERNSIAPGGKFQEDFRVTHWGAFLRRTWLDELPMLLNWLKRDVKLVGVRPLSRQYLELYPLRVREKRLAAKPGLIPPYYADLPGDFDEIVASEEAYLDAHAERPLQTDLRYLFKALHNILFERARSA